MTRFSLDSLRTLAIAGVATAYCAMMLVAATVGANGSAFNGIA